MAGSALSFAAGSNNVHQVLGVVPSPDGDSGMPATPRDFDPAGGDGYSPATTFVSGCGSPRWWAESSDSSSRPGVLPARHRALPGGRRR